MSHRTVNEKIADLLLEQTYAERMEIAASWRDIINDMTMDGSKVLNRDDVANLFQGWAEAQMEGAS